MIQSSSNPLAVITRYYCIELAGTTSRLRSWARSAESPQGDAISRVEPFSRSFRFVTVLSFHRSRMAMTPDDPRSRREFLGSLAALSAAGLAPQALWSARRTAGGRRPKAAPGLPALRGL